MRPARPLRQTPRVVMRRRSKRALTFRGDWWTLFHSPALSALVAQALKNNHDLKAAQAALRVAHEDVLAQRGSFVPAVSAGFSASRQKDPSAALAPVPSNNAYLYSPNATIRLMSDALRGASPGNACALIATG